MEKVAWRVEGMDCNTCALHIHKYLEKKGMKDVKVNFATGHVSFENPKGEKESTLASGIQDLGYEIVEHKREKIRKPWFRSHLQRFWFCFPFTALLMSHMIPGLHLHWLMNHWVQLALTLPVYVVGMGYFGRSAWKSLRNSMPNMNVLITIGATAAFIYSLYGSLTGQPEKYLFYETAATILTLVFLGNYLEEASIGSTQRELNKLVKSQKVMATMIAFDDQHQEQLFESRTIIRSREYSASGWRSHTHQIGRTSTHRLQDPLGRSACERSHSHRRKCPDTEAEKRRTHRRQFDHRWHR